jgi:hypothetical protein
MSVRDSIYAGTEDAHILHPSRDGGGFVLVDEFDGVAGGILRLLVRQS